MTVLHIFRHGETEWNRKGLMQGHHDSPLSETGRNDAVAVSRDLADVKFDLAISSSSGRARETTSILLNADDAKIVAMDGLREINLGNWEGRLKSEVQQEYQEQYNNFWHAPLAYIPDGGETFLELWERVAESTQSILRNYRKQTILVVSHAATVKAMMSFFAGRPVGEIWNPPIADNLSHSVVQIEGQHVSIHKFCGQEWGGV